MRRNTYVGAGFLVVILVLAIGSAVFQRRAAVEAAGVQAPTFEVDPFWPKPLPNHWLIGMTIGVAIDAQEHVWIVHRQGSLEPGELHASTNPPMAQCCAAAPPVLEFDQAGNLLRHWGGPGEGYEWPDGNHGIFIDYKGNVWIAGNGAPDSHILKFTKDGKFLMQVGKKGARRKEGAAAGQGEGAGGIPAPADGKHRRVKHCLDQNVAHRIGMKIVKDFLERERMLCSERQDDGVVGGSGLQFEIE